MGWIFRLYSPLLHTGTSMAGSNSVDTTHQQRLTLTERESSFSKIDFLIPNLGGFDQKLVRFLIIYFN